jgi:aspartate carbamoyltransferase catalytic subunit
MRSFAGRDILSLKDFERAEFEHVFSVCDRLEPIARERRNTDLLAHKTLITAFYQPSTRTRLSHEAAMHRLGGRVLGFADPKMTRAGDFYQESIKDTVHMLEYYGDVMVMRHFLQGAPAEAAHWASIPVINAGDGWGEHPTQVLTDLYTVAREHGGIDGRTFVAIGDGRMRTMHSLGYALTQFDVDLVFISPAELAVTDEFLGELADANLHARRAEHVDEVIAEADIIYMEPVVQADYTQSRVEDSGDDKGMTPANYRVTREVLAKAKRDSVILHSLPRMDELPPDVDSTRHARYWQEAYYGVVMRMALLSLVLGAME